MMFRKCLITLILLTVIQRLYCASGMPPYTSVIKSVRLPRNVDANDPVSRVRELLRQSRTEDGVIDLNAILSENLNDPVPIENFNVSSSGFITDVFGQFTELQLYGLKGFQLNKISINFSKMNLSAEMSLPLLSIVGRYYLKGSVTFLPVSGEGPFWMNLTSIKLKGHSVMKSSPGGKLMVDDIKMDSEVEEVALQFENLMGGGTWGSISNSLLNQLGELILGELEPTLLGELSSYIKYQFDNVLFDHLPDGFLDPESGNIVDSILTETSRLMMEKGIEPLPLPDYKEVYERSVFFVTSRGELEFSEGSLHGLSTLRKKGDVITVFANDSLMFEADFEFENLTGSYKWEAKAFGADTDGRMEMQLSSVEGFARLRQSMKVGSQLELDTLYVKDIKHVWLDLQGLGRWDYVMESIINLVTNGLKLQLADSIAEPIRKSMQEQLDLLNLNSLLELDNSI